MRCSQSEKNPTHVGESVCAGGRGVYKFMWVSEGEGEGVYVRGREGSYVQKKEEYTQMWVNEGEEGVRVGE